LQVAPQFVFLSRNCFVVLFDESYSEFHDNIDLVGSEFESARYSTSLLASSDNRKYFVIWGRATDLKSMASDSPARISVDGLDVDTFVARDFITAFEKLGFDSRSIATFLQFLLGTVMPALDLADDGEFNTLINDFCAISSGGKLNVYKYGYDSVALLELPVANRKVIAICPTGIATEYCEPKKRLSGLISSDYCLWAFKPKKLPSRPRHCIIVLQDSILVGEFTVILDPLAGDGADQPSVDRLHVFAALFAISDRRQRNVLSDKLAIASFESSISVSLPVPFSFSIEVGVAVDDGVFVSGWMDDPTDVLESVELVDHGIIASIGANWLKWRGAVVADGKQKSVVKFAAYLEGRPKANLIDRAILCLHLRTGENLVVVAPKCAGDYRSIRAEIISTIDEAALDQVMFESVFNRPIEALQRVICSEQAIRFVRDYGIKSERLASIIIPLYRNFEFIRNQILAFSRDEHIFRNCEIIYVNDDPVFDEDLKRLLSGYGLLFSLDIRLVGLSINGGYALSNNMAASIANGKYLVLMNSDVVPDRPGWLDKSTQRLATMPDYSVVGPKLLYSDDSLQHAGMYFHRHFSGFWQNMHYYKGYGRNIPQANVERVVGAVTGACMVLKKESFQRVGGFTTSYVIGDYEDSDLCLKLRNLGGVCLYYPGAELYHFERQSMEAAEGRNDMTTSAYNRALHFSRWNGSGLEQGYLEG
jgi:GT2 family glycosyltransferase